MLSTILSVDTFRAVLANVDEIKNPHPIHGHFHGQSFFFMFTERKAVGINVIYGRALDKPERTPLVTSLKSSRTWAWYRFIEYRCLLFGTF